LKLLFAAVGL